jgi:ornithine cyclodeaminase/alanine dehydrogenase-like protein (mu-crystallin family)
MQRDEAQDDCLAQADVVVFHTREKEHEYVSTDFSAMEKQYGFVMRDHPPRDLDWNKFPDLGELVAGRISGREGAEQRTLFLNSTGVGAQFTGSRILSTAEPENQAWGMKCRQSGSSRVFSHEVRYEKRSNR